MSIHSYYINTKMPEMNNSTLRLRVYPSVKQSSGKILFFHGFPGSPLEEKNEIPEMLAFLGYTTVLFNYPGLWAAEGEFSIESIFLSVKYALKVMNEHPDLKNQNLPLILFGESFGGAIAVHVVAERLSNISRVCLRSPLLDFDPILQYLPATFQALEMAEILRLQKEGFDFQALSIYNPKKMLIKTFPVPFWGVIGKNDEVLPGYVMVKAVMGLENFKLELWNDFPHNYITPHLWNKYVNKLEEFLSQK